MLDTIEKNPIQNFEDRKISELPIYEQVTWLEFFEATDSLVFTMRTAQESGFSNSQISSLFKDMGRSWWEQFYRIIPGDITKLTHREISLERPNIDEEIEVTERKEIKLEQLEEWVETNSEVLGDLDISDLAGYSSDG